MNGRRCHGFTYLLVLFFIAATGAALAAAGMIWHTEAQRAREADLLFIGGQFRQAIRSYYEGLPEAARTFPKSFDDLLEDKRMPTVRRHLRRLWRDPMTGRADWGLVRLPDGRITGVYSLAEGVPRKVSGFPEGFEGFDGASTYRDWVFSWQPSAAPAAVGVGAGGDASTASPGSATPSAVPAGPVVANPAPAQAPVDTPPRKDPRECTTARQADLALCRDLGSFAETDAVRRCTVSATARFQACLSGGEGPALVTGR